MIRLASTYETLEVAKAPPSAFPTNRLPREILAEIFWECVPEIMETAWMSRSIAPLFLCSICSSWRALALATPKIWTSVGVLIRNPNMDSLIGAHIINTWLERSGTLPLTLHLKYDYDAPPK